MSKIYMVIDSNFLCHKAKYTTSKLNYRSKGTGIIYGFLNQVLTLYNQLEPDHIIFVWDSKKSIRNHFFPFYKAKRKLRQKLKTEKEKQEDFIASEQFDLLRTEILHEIGFRNNFMQVGLEGDDIMARLSWSNIIDDGHYLILVTADEDLYQMISDKKVEVYNPTTKTHWTYDYFKDTYEIDPPCWAWVKEIAGCITDNIPGIEGVGESTAIAFIRNKLKTHSKKYKAMISDEGKRIINRNIFLIRLPFKTTKKMKIVKDEFNKKKFVKMCRRYGLNQFKANADEWEEMVS